MVHCHAQVAAVRAALDRHSEQLDEALLSNAFAWIRKCTEDRFDTMVQLIQKVRPPGWSLVFWFVGIRREFHISVQQLTV